MIILLLSAAVAIPAPHPSWPVQVRRALTAYAAADRPRSVKVGCDYSRPARCTVEERGTLLPIYLNGSQARGIARYSATVSRTGRVTTVRSSLFGAQRFTDG